MNNLLQSGQCSENVMLHVGWPFKTKHRLHGFLIVQLLNEKFILIWESQSEWCSAKHHSGF